MIVQDGLRRMLTEREDAFYYVTVTNENYHHPSLPEGAEEGILAGMYRLRAAEGDGPPVRLLGSGAILNEVVAAADLLAEEHGVAAEVWSVTSFTELRREGLEAERWNRLHPDEVPRASYVEQALGEGDGPVVAATDYMRALPDGIRAFVPGRLHVLGTDGFGRSDTRATLRRFFEVDRQHVAAAALSALAADGAIDPADAAAAIAGYGIETEAEAPWLR